MDIALFTNPIAESCEIAFKECLHLKIKQVMSGYDLETTISKDDLQEYPIPVSKYQFINLK